MKHIILYPGGILWIYVAWKILTSGNKEIKKVKKK
jgi:hypothetical protein